MYPIVGFIDNEIQVRIWGGDGHFTRGYESYYDLINIPEPPKLRPWKPEEVPVGALIRGSRYGVRVILGCGSDTDCEFKYVLYIGGNGKIAGDSLEGCLRYREHSTDFGKTWRPCGVLE